MIERDNNDQFVRIRCDGCGEPSPPTSDLIINRGLNGMGWDCKGGKHKCPTCKDDAAPVAMAAE